MNLYTRHVKPFGFSPTGMFSDAKWDSLYRRKNPEQRAVTFIQGTGDHYTIGVFRMTAAQYKAFDAGKVTLLPPKSCCPARGGTEVVDNPEIRYNGPVKNLDFLAGILELLP